MTKIIRLFFVLMIGVAFNAFAAFEDVATDEKVTPPPPPPKTTTTVKTQTPAPAPVAPTPAPAVPAPLDLNTLKFTREIGGWRYKNWDANMAEVSQTIKVAMTAVKPLIDKLPADAKIQVIGHTDGVGPEYPEGDKPGNIAIGEKRANAVVDYIVQNYNISRDRFVVSSKGSSELKISSDKTSAANRRVIIKFEP